MRKAGGVVKNSQKLYPPSPTTAVKSTLVVRKTLRRAGRLFTDSFTGGEGMA
jgi:hypothetical protein